MFHISQVLRKHEKMVRSRPVLLQVLVLFMSVLLFASTGWTGEEGKGHKRNPEQKLSKLTKRLGLTEEQQKKIRPILEQKVQKMQALHEQMKEARQQAVAQIEAELTPEQVETYKELREKRKQRKHDGKGKHKKGHKGKHKYKDHDDDDHEGKESSD